MRGVMDIPSSGEALWSPPTAGFLLQRRERRPAMVERCLGELGRYIWLGIFKNKSTI